MTRNLAAAQNLERGSALARVSWVAAVNQDVSINEGSHEADPVHRCKVLRGSSRDSRE